MNFPPYLKFKHIKVLMATETEHLLIVLIFYCLYFKTSGCQDILENNSLAFVLFPIEIAK